MFYHDVDTHQKWLHICPKFPLIEYYKMKFLEQKSHTFQTLSLTPGQMRDRSCESSLDSPSPFFMLTNGQFGALNRPDCQQHAAVHLASFHPPTPSYCQRAGSLIVLYICSDVTSTSGTLAFWGRPVGLYPADLPMGLNPVVVRPTWWVKPEDRYTAGRRRNRPDVTRSP